MTPSKSAIYVSQVYWRETLSNPLRFGRIDIIFCVDTCNCLCPGSVSFRTSSSPFAPLPSPLKGGKGIYTCRSAIQNDREHSAENSLLSSGHLRPSPLKRGFDSFFNTNSTK